MIAAGGFDWPGRGVAAKACGVQRALEDVLGEGALRLLHPGIWLGLTALLLAACATKPGVERCREDTLPGAWLAEESGNLWVFQPDGKLSCEGPCRFTATTGEPVSWAYEPNANVWSRPIDYVKLTFTKATFEGVFGSFRCYIEDNGQRLRLQPENDPAMVFVRQ